MTNSPVLNFVTTACSRLYDETENLSLKSPTWPVDDDPAAPGSVTVEVCPSTWSWHETVGDASLPQEASMAVNAKLTTIHP